MAPSAISDAAAMPAVAPHLELRREVGRHGGWTVYEARRIDVDRRELVSVGPLKSCTLGRDGNQLEAAVARLKKLSHPVLAPIQCGGVAGELAYIEFERFAGQPLVEFLESRRLSDVQRMEIVLQLAEALAYLHEHGISYAAALDGGAWVGRRHGSLRLAVKLFRWERVGKFMADGGDQRAFGELVKRVAAGTEGAVAKSLTELAARCSEAQSDAPKLKNVTAELLTAIKGMNGLVAKASIVHVAEPLNVRPPKAPPRANAAAAASRAEGGKNAGTWGGAGIAIAIIVGALSAVIRNQDKLGPSRPSYTPQPVPWTGSVMPGNVPSNIPDHDAIYGSATPPTGIVSPQAPTPPRYEPLSGVQVDDPSEPGFPKPRWPQPAHPGVVDRGFPEHRSGIRHDPFPNRSLPSQSLPMGPPTQSVPGGFQAPHFGR
jgi:hypothetical protein